MSKELASKGQGDILLNLAVSPVLPGIKRKSKVTNPIGEVVTLTRKQINKAIFVVTGISLAVGVVAAAMFLDITGHLH